MLSNEPYESKGMATLKALGVQYALCRNINVTIWYGRFSAILTFCCLSQFQRQETHPKNKNCYKEVTLYPMDLP